MWSRRAAAENAQRAAACAARARAITTSPPDTIVTARLSTHYLPHADPPQSGSTSGHLGGGRPESRPDRHRSRMAAQFSNDPPRTGPDPPRIPSGRYPPRIPEILGGMHSGRDVRPEFREFWAEPAQMRFWAHLGGFWANAASGVWGLHCKAHRTRPRPPASPPCPHHHDAPRTATRWPPHVILC